jgi:hypothetical protein
MENNDLDETNAENQLRVIAQYSSRIPEIPLVNVRIQKPRETTQYSRLPSPHVRPPSSLLPLHEVFANLHTNYDNTDSCALMEDFVRTFDNVTYKLPDNQCQYLLAKDCSPKERFAVFASQMDESAKTKVITMFVAGSEIKLTPPTQHNLVQVVVDGKPHEVTFNKPITVKQNNNQNQIRVYLRKTASAAINPITVIQADKEDVELLYDGKNAKVLVGGKYQGKTCGLCGDNNDESDDEMTGPDGCIYTDDEDFANSYSLSGEHCEQAPQPLGHMICPQKSDSSEEQRSRGQIVLSKQTIKIVNSPQGYAQRSTLPRGGPRAQRLSQSGSIESQEFQQRPATRQQARQQARQQGRQGDQLVVRPSTLADLTGREKQQVGRIVDAQQQIVREQANKQFAKMRTAFIQRDDMVCFTTQPVMQCNQGYQPQQSSDFVADFHCLPQSSPFTKQLMVEAATKVIKQLASKRVDIQQQIQVPSRCILVAQ